MLHHQENVTHGQFALVTSEIGNYRACFWLDGNHQSASLNLDWKFGRMAAEDAESVAKKKHIKVLTVLTNLLGLQLLLHLDVYPPRAHVVSNDHLLSSNL